MLTKEEFERRYLLGAWSRNFCTIAEVRELLNEIDKLRKRCSPAWLDDIETWEPGDPPLPPGKRNYIDVWENEGGKSID